MATWFWITVGSGWLGAVAFAPILARRCAGAKAWGWLAIMVAAPWAGIAAYLLLGENPLGRRRVVRYREVLRKTGAAQAVAQLQKHAAGASLGPAASRMERLAQAAGAPAAVRGNDGEVLASSEDIARRLLADIRRAQHHVHMVFYIFRDDTTGRRVADALIEASRRGVACRVLADAVGSYPLFLGLGRRMQAGGVDLRPALPINPLRRRLARIDLRNHRKVAVIDGRVAYLGSWNVADADYGRKDITAFHDLSIRLTGPVVLQAQGLFLEDWHFETDETLAGEGALAAPAPTGQAVMQVLPSGPMYPAPSMRDLLVSAIHQANDRVTLTTPYLVPDAALLLALRLAARHGARVDVIVPRRTDLRLVDAAGRSYMREMAAEGLRVHVHQHGILHAKALTVDDGFGTLGSANFDVRSFRLNIEANLLTYSPALVARLREHQEGYMAGARRLDAEALKRYPRAKRLCEDLARLLNPLI
jgi:cardiolipin synthase